MSESKPENLIRFAVYSIGIALVIMAVSSLVAAFRSPDTLLVNWVSKALQIFIIVGGFAFSAAISVSAWIGIGIMWTSLNRKIVDLQRSYSEELQQIRKRTPVIAAGLVLIADAALLIADKSFGEDTLAVVIVSLLMLIIFFVANILATADKKFERIAGILFYVLGIVILPLFAFWTQNWDIELLITLITKLDILTIIVLLLSVIIYISLPFLAYRYTTNE